MDLTALLGWAEWLIPAGGLGAVIVWLTSKAVRSAQAAKECHDAYKAMYDDLKGTTEELAETVIKLQQENVKTFELAGTLASVLQLVALCPRNSSCAAAIKLQKLIKDGKVDLEPFGFGQRGGIYKKRPPDHGGGRLPRDGTEDEDHRPDDY